MFGKSKVQEAFRLADSRSIHVFGGEIGVEACPSTRNDPAGFRV